MNNWRKFLQALVICLLVLSIPLNSAMAARKTDDNDGNNGNGNGNGNDDTETPPNDPGVSGDHTVIRTESAMWVLPHGDTFIINGQEVNIIEDWETIEIISRTQRGNSHTYTVEIGGLLGGEGCEDGSCYVTCGDGSGLESCFLLDGDEDDDCDGGGNGNGCNGNGNGNGNGSGNSNPNCGGAWVRPGTISATGEKMTPNNPVVVGQDNEGTGVTVKWSVRIEPTAVIYEDWQLIGHRHVACVEGDLEENGNGNIYDPGDADCPHGWHAVIEHIYGCVEEYEFFRESVNNLDAIAELTEDSRNWITGELAGVYPGAGLLNPEWAYSVSPNCTWINDVCFWDFAVNIPVTDPGWYDIKLAGTTAGTQVFTPRGFELNVGQFGVYMIDNTALIN
jgi:hypothetical protein